MTTVSENIESQAVKALETLVLDVPTLQLKDVQAEPSTPGREIDILAHVQAGDRTYTLICEVKASGQPRFVRLAVAQLRSYLAHAGIEATPILIAPYISPEAQEICRQNRVGFLDLEGNARITFGPVFIERSVESKPSPERRDLKSLFKPKSAQVLRTLLNDPAKAWRVADLAANAEVSLGHVSNVRSALLNREWAQVSDEGLVLSDPNALLDAWREAYEPPGKRVVLYTTLHGPNLEKAIREGLHAGPGSNAILASFSAAQWLAPYARTATHYFYADKSGLERLRVALKLEPASKGGNVVVIVPKDDGLFGDVVEPTPGILATSTLQTYLDLYVAGDRGREAAEHLRRQELTWPK